MDPATPRPSGGPPRRSPGPPRQPLAGVRVLDCGTVYAAPITAMLLGDFGGEFVDLPVAQRARRLLELAATRP